MPVDLCVAHTAAMSGSKGSSGLGLFTFSCITANTRDIFQYGAQRYLDVTITCGKRDRRFPLRINQMSYSDGAGNPKADLVMQDRYTYAAFFVDPWMIYLGQECNL